MRIGQAFHLFRIKPQQVGKKDVSRAEANRHHIRQDFPAEGPTGGELTDEIREKANAPSVLP